MNIENVPLELRTFNQWVVWRFEDLNEPKPTKMPYSPNTGRKAKPNDSSTWATFEQAFHAWKSSNTYNGIGFVLSDKDPYTFIDLDDTKGDEKALKKQQEIVKNFDSFSERSPSGNGLHIIVKGSVPMGRRRSFVELYSSLRYMTVTGDVYRNEPIRDYHEQINALWSQMGEGKKTSVFYAGLEEAKLTDESVLSMAATAKNAEKFNALYYEGDWQKYYPSQSEADFALFDIIAFYSENGAQTQRIFLDSVLGQREKSRAQYRIDYLLKRCFDRMLPPIDMDGLQNKLQEILENRLKEESKGPKSLQNEIDEPDVQFPNVELKPENTVYSVPPGLVGELARFIYAQAPRPVAEIALAGALGLMSGIVGRSYNVGGTGLNQYILVLANTGVGKEAVHKGIDKIMGAVAKKIPESKSFIGPAEISSSQAITKYMCQGPTSFVSIVGEFGMKLKEMGSVNASPHLAGLRRFLLIAFSKSGSGDVMYPMIYADKEKNTSDIKSPAFSMLGESTPHKFYEGLHEGLFDEGFLPRFTIIEYKGGLGKFNDNHVNVKPTAELVEKMATICANSIMLNSQNKVVNVESSKEAKTMLLRFRDRCDLEQNSTGKEFKRQLWSRGHLKAIKLSALVAVGINPYDPLISAESASWAINIVTNDIKNFTGRFNAGDIGEDNDEMKQLAKVSDTIKFYITSDWKGVSNYVKGLSALHKNKIIPYAYMQRKLASISVFKKDRQGSSASIKRAIQTLIERGDLQEVPRSTLANNYNVTVRSFMISNMNAFDLE